MLDLICTWWTRRFCRQVNKEISSCFWTASTCVQKNSFGMLGWCSRLTYMHGNRGLDSHNSAHDKTSCQGLDLDLDRFVGRSPVGNNTNFVVLSEWTCKFSLIMVVNSPLKSVNCCSIDCGFRQTVPIWYCGWKGVPVTPGVVANLGVLLLAKAIYTTDPNTKSQSCIHDCRPNPNPNPNPTSSTSTWILSIVLWRM